MMAYSEDQIALAAEYVLGTLDADERAQADALMAVDKDFVALVDAWSRKLDVLNQMVGLVEPRPEVWERIRIAAGLSGVQQAMVHPQAPATAAAAPAASALAGDGSPAGISQDGSNVVDFPQQARRWRNIATGMMAIAAALVAMIGLQATRPELLPEGLRPKASQQVAQVRPPAPAPAVAQAQYVALLQTDATSPAFILTVDAATKNFTVRKVGAERQPGKDYELWIVSDRLQAPRSLGVIGGHDFTTAAALAAYDPAMVSQATYAVTVEPEGGSPTGQATGPIVFTGKLIETVPPPAR